MYIPLSADTVPALVTKNVGEEDAVVQALGTKQAGKRSQTSGEKRKPLVLVVDLKTYTRTLYTGIGARGQVFPGPSCIGYLVDVSFSESIYIYIYPLLGCF